MKKILTILALGLMTTAFAVDQFDSWETIRSTKGLKLDNISAFVGYNTSVFDVCIENESLRTIKKQPVYEWRRVSKEQDQKVLVGYKFFSHPIKYTTTQTFCHGKNGGRCEVVTTQNVQNTKPLVSVSKYAGDRGGRENGSPVYKVIFQKQYEIPGCYEL